MQLQEMNYRIFSMFLMLLFITTLTEGVGVEPQCRCRKVESRRIGKMIERVELRPPSSHCPNTEIIAVLKETGQHICLDQRAPWVRRVIDKILSSRLL